MPRKPAVLLTKGIFSSSRTSTYKRRHLYKKLKNKKLNPKKQAETTPAKVTARTPRLRSSITPGTILILLAGVHAGKRVVFLRQLASGLLLITGPYNVNGVPLRRVNQAYVIATSTKINIAKVNVPETLNDAYFRRAPATAQPKKSIKNFLNQKDKKPVEQPKNKLPDQRVADQKNLDSQISPLIEKVPLLRDYVKSRFSLRKGQYPHELKF